VIKFRPLENRDSFLYASVILSVSMVVCFVKSWQITSGMEMLVFRCAGHDG
jgi:hypothetical protein